MMENDLREIAVRAIANYMHHELFELTKSAEMLPWIKDSANDLLTVADNAIKATKEHPLASILTKKITCTFKEYAINY